MFTAAGSRVEAKMININFSWVPVMSVKSQVLHHNFEKGSSRTVTNIFKLHM